MRMWVYTIKLEDIGRPVSSLPGCAALRWHGFGTVQGIDVHKRLYSVKRSAVEPGIIQMENNEQRDKRLAKERKNVKTQRTDMG